MTRLAVKGWLGALVLALWASAGWGAAGPEARALQVKAAFILNIARFMDWPPAAFPPEQSDIRLCLWGRNPLGEAVEIIRGRKVDERPLDIWIIDRLQQREFCQILFLSRGQLATLVEQEAPLAYPFQLTIADLTGAAEPRALNGRALITLIRKGARIGIEINVDAAAAAGLTPSSELLKLGKIYTAKGP